MSTIATYASPDVIRVSSATVWTGRIATAIASLFLLFDASIHLATIPPVVEAFARLGVPIALSVTIGIVELVCLAAYVIPRTSFLGAVLLTGYLGGAVATQLRAGSSAFETVFPFIIGALVWGGLLLRRRGLWTVVTTGRVA